MISTTETMGQFRGFLRPVQVHSQAGFKLAPPTRNPSTSGCLANSLQFFSVTLPP